MMRRAKTKSVAKTFQEGTDLSDLMAFAMKSIETEGGHKPIDFGPWEVDTPISITKHKYVVTITKITDRCETCGAKLDGTYDGHYDKTKEAKAKIKCPNGDHEAVYARAELNGHFWITCKECDIKMME